MKQAILFDLDGTLADTVPDLAAAVDSMQARLGLPARGEDRVRLWVGNGVERLVQRALTDSLDATPDPDLQASGMAAFMAAYAAQPCRDSRCYPGVDATLRRLHHRGYQLACVTNKPARFTRLLLEALGIEHYFRLVISGDTLSRRKPDPLPLRYAGEQFETTPSRMLMVGDSLTDVEAARAAGIDIVCVSYGYNQGRDIRRAQPDRVIDSLAELIDLLPQTAAA